MISVISWHVYPRLGGISPHGVGIAVGFFLGGVLMTRLAERKGISSEHVWNMLMRAVFGVIVGARLFYVVGHITDYWPNLLDIFKVWEGGLVFYGGVAGGILAAVPYARRNNLPFWDVLDSAAPGFPLGLIFGRIGDLIVGDHLGGPTTLPFAFRASGGVPVSVPLDPSCLAQFARGGLGCHATALYDLWNVIVLLPLVLVLARTQRARGFLIVFTATFYGLARFFVDFARTGTDTYAGLRGTQWVSLFLVLVGVWYTVERARGEIEPEPIPEEQNPLIAREGGIQPEEWPPEELERPLGTDTAPEPPEYPVHPPAEERDKPGPPEHPLG